MGEDALPSLLDEWRKTVDKLDELQQWLVKAGEELKGSNKGDPRWLVYRDVEAAAQRLDKELGQIERKQEQSLTEHLEATGPVTIELQDGSRRVVSATTTTAGGPTDLLPGDLLRVWRVASVFQGSVVGAEGQPALLTFGDTEQIEWFKPRKKRR